MNLNEIIFTDGKIVSYEIAEGRLTLKFRHYSGDLIYIYFFGVISYADLDGVGFDLAGHKLTQKENSYRLELLDDESTVVFYVEFDSATYQTD